MATPELRAELPRPSRWRRWRPVLAVLAGGALLATSGAILAIAFVPPIEHAAVTIEVPPAVIQVVAAPVPPPPPSKPEPPSNPLGCADANSFAVDDPIGTAMQAIEIERLAQEPALADRLWERPAAMVAASRVTPHIAVLHDGVVRISADDGRTFHRVFGDDDRVQTLAIADDGVLFALRSDLRLLIRMPDGKVRVREQPVRLVGGECDHCGEHLVTLGTKLVWIADGKIAITEDRGASWRLLVDTGQDTAWGNSWSNSIALPWRGAVYELNHYVDRCGVDDWPVYRLDASAKAGHRVAHTIFHEYHSAEHLAKLVPADDASTEWRWRGRCWRGGEDSQELYECTPSDSPRWQMLAVRTLRPVEGARTLAYYDGSLVEVCEHGARQVMRRFPFARIAAVDAAGRPLVALDDMVLRWSPAHGWRRIYKAPASVTPTNE